MKDEKTDTEEKLESTRRAYFSGDLAVLKQVFPEWQQAYDEGQSDSAVWEGLLRCRIVQLFEQRQIDFDKLLEVSALLECYEQQFPDRPETLAFKISCCAAEMVAARSVIEQQTLFQKIQEMLVLGNNEFPGNCDIALVAWKFYIAMPEQHGGGKDKADRFFDVAMQDPQYGEFVKQRLEKDYA